MGMFALITFLADFVYEVALALWLARTRRDVHWFLGIAAAVLLLALVCILRARVERWCLQGRVLCATLLTCSYFVPRLWDSPQAQRAKAVF
jgi:hypothetical protein